MKKRFLALFLALFFVFPLAACRSLILRYDLSGQVSSLDPQFTTSADARTVLYNAMEGLYRLSEAGDLIPAGASGHTLSADGKTYTFTLRQDARWSDGSPVTAKDYVFASGCSAPTPSPLTPESSPPSRGLPPAWKALPSPWGFPPPETTPW